MTFLMITTLHTTAIKQFCNIFFQYKVHFIYLGLKTNFFGISKMIFYAQQSGRETKDVFRLEIVPKK